MNGRIIKKVLVCWALLLAIFLGSMVVVQCVPLSWVDENALASAYQNDVDAQSSASSDPTRWVSSDTVAVMLSMATHRDGTVLEASMNGAYYWSENAFQSVEEGLGTQANTHYEWYWHGWMIILKPLLVFFDLATIERLLAIAMAVLLGTVIALSSSTMKRGGVYGVLLAAAFAATNSFFAIQVLPYAFSLLLALVGALLVIIDYRRHSFENKAWTFSTFFIIGALTTFFDFLVTPAITLLVPLAFYLLLKGEGREFAGWTLGSMVKSIVLLILFWAIGYAGLWLSKWIVASFVLGENIVTIGLNQVFFRIGTPGTADYRSSLIVDQWDGTDVNFIESIRKNAGALFHPLSIWLVVVVCAAIFAVALAAKRKDASLATIVGMGLVAMGPYVWYAVLTNHSIIHYYFTCRVQLATLFAITAVVAYAFDWQAFRTRFLKMGHMGEGVEGKSSADCYVEKNSQNSTQQQ